MERQASRPVEWIARELRRSAERQARRAGLIPADSVGQAKIGTMPMFRVETELELCRYVGMERQARRAGLIPADSVGQAKIGTMPMFRVETELELRRYAESSTR
jgi:ribosomal protein L25 (general stress protein Ctc)